MLLFQEARLALLSLMVLPLRALAVDDEDISSMMLRGFAHDYSLSPSRARPPELTPQPAPPVYVELYIMRDCIFLRADG